MGSHLNIKPILTGLLAIIVLLFFSSICLTFLLHFTSIQESSIHWFIMPITLITLFIGGLIAGYTAGGKGWYVGAVTGLGFILLSWLASFLGFDLSLTSKQFLLYSLYLLAAIIGGIIGVNLSPQR